MGRWNGNVLLADGSSFRSSTMDQRNIPTGLGAAVIRDHCDMVRNLDRDTFVSRNYRVTESQICVIYIGLHVSRIDRDCHRLVELLCRDDSGIDNLSCSRMPKIEVIQKEVKSRGLTPFLPTFVRQPPQWKLLTRAEENHDEPIDERMDAAPPPPTRNWSPPTRTRPGPGTSPARRGSNIPNALCAECPSSRPSPRPSSSTRPKTAHH